MRGIGSLNRPEAAVKTTRWPIGKWENSYFVFSKLRVIVGASQTSDGPKY